MRGPAIDSDVTGEELDKDVRRELTTLRAEAAESAAKHLVMAARLLDDDPEAAYAHAEAARKHGPRVAVIREAFGLAAYHAGKYAEALAELRAARRISGNQDHWPMMADCERALGKPEKALQMAAAPEVSQLSRAGKVEMRIVAAGARADLGQLDAAVVTLQSPELNDKKASDWLPRLRFAYAAALEAVGRTDEARTWFERAAEVDPDGLTDASERLAELDGVVIVEDEFDGDAGEIDKDAVEAAIRAALARKSGAVSDGRGGPVELAGPAELAGRAEDGGRAEDAGPGEDGGPTELAGPAEHGAAVGRGVDAGASAPAVAVPTVSLTSPFQEPVPTERDEPAEVAEERAELEGVLFLDPGDLG